MHVILQQFRTLEGTLFPPEVALEIGSLQELRTGRTREKTPSNLYVFRAHLHCKEVDLQFIMGDVGNQTQNHRSTHNQGQL